MNVIIDNQQEDLPISDTQIRDIAIAVVSFEKKNYDEVAIHLVTLERIAELHQIYFDDNTPTDCISFPMDEENEKSPFSILGDLFVCPQIAIDYGKEHHKNPFEELTLYIVHSLLHLMGYGDQNDADRTEMRKAELKHLENLRSKSLILNSPL